MVLQQDAVAGEHVAGGAAHIQGLAGREHLDHGCHGIGELIVLRQVGHAGAHELHGGEVREHRGKLFLNELEAADGGTELLAVQGVARGDRKGRHAVAQGLPGRTSTGGFENQVDVLEAVAIGQAVLVGDLQVLDHDVRLVDGALGDLARDDLGAEALGVVTVVLFLDHERLDLAVGLVTGVEHNDVRGVTVTDPALMAVDDPLVAFLAGGGLQRDGVGAVVRFGQGKRSGLLQGGHDRKPAVALFLVAEHVDTSHAQVRVHAQERVERAVDATEFARHDARGPTREPGAAVAGDEGADDAQLRQLGEHRLRVLCALPVLIDGRQDFFLAEGPHLVPQLDVFGGKILVQEEEVGVIDDGGHGGPFGLREHMMVAATVRRRRSVLWRDRGVAQRLMHVVIQWFGLLGVGVELHEHGFRHDGVPRATRARSPDPRPARAALCGIRRACG